MEQNFGTIKLYGPEAFRFESLGDLPGIADEVVPGKRKLEPKLALLQFRPSAKHNRRVPPASPSTLITAMIKNLAAP